MRMQRCVVSGSCAKRLKDFRARRTRDVSDADSNRRRAAFQAFCNQVLDLRDLIIGGSVLDGTAFGRTSRGSASVANFGSAHEDSTCANVAHRSSIMDEP